MIFTSYSNIETQLYPKGDAEASFSGPSFCTHPNYCFALTQITKLAYATSIKGRKTNIFSFGSHTVSVATIQLCCGSKKQSGYYIRKWAKLGSNKTLFTKSHGMSDLAHRQGTI